jgi:hypothetical protein
MLHQLRQGFRCADGHDGLLMEPFTQWGVGDALEEEVAVLLCCDLWVAGRHGD